MWPSSPAAARRWPGSPVRSPGSPMPRSTWSCTAHPGWASQRSPSTRRGAWPTGSPTGSSTPTWTSAASGGNQPRSSPTCCAPSTLHAPIPDDLPGRIRRLRTLLAGRRVLLLLDNAVDEAQVRPLLAPAPGCATLVTSRSPLAGLEGAAAYHLDILPESESVQLLRRLVGAERVDGGTRGGGGDAARWCGGLPLALRIAGAKLARRPDWTLGYLAGRLAGDRRLDELTAGDLAVRGSLGIGYRDLSPPQQCLFRRLGRLSAPDFAPWVAAAMLQVPESEAERAIDALVEAGLLRPLGVDAAGQPRYRLHDLTRLYARERATLEGAGRRRRPRPVRPASAAPDPAVAGAAGAPGARHRRHRSAPRRADPANRRPRNPARAVPGWPPNVRCWCRACSTCARPGWPSRPGGSPSTSRRSSSPARTTTTGAPPISQRSPPPGQ